MQAKLIRWGWLRRTLEVHMPDGPHLVEYDGAGIGYEQVIVDGVVVREISVLWFVPRFEFKLGGWPSGIEVRVWPWLMLRSLSLRVKDLVVYAEGFALQDLPPYERNDPSDDLA